MLNTIILCVIIDDDIDGHQSDVNKLAEWMARELEANESDDGGNHIQEASQVVMTGDYSIQEIHRFLKSEEHM